MVDNPLCMYISWYTTAIVMVMPYYMYSIPALVICTLLPVLFCPKHTTLTINTINFHAMYNSEVGFI